MVLVALKCPHCGGDIQMDEAREFGYCMYCGTKVMRESSEADRQRNCVKLAQNALAAGEADKAVRFADEALVLDAKDRGAWLVKGAAALDEAVDSGNYNACAAMFAEAVGCAPDRTASFRAVTAAVDGEFAKFAARGRKYLAETGDRYYGRIVLDLPARRFALLDRLAAGDPELAAVVQESRTAAAQELAAAYETNLQAALKAVAETDWGNVAPVADYALNLTLALRGAANRSACVKTAAAAVTDRFAALTKKFAVPANSERLYLLDNIRICYASCAGGLRQAAAEFPLDPAACLRTEAAGQAVRGAALLETAAGTDDWPAFAAAAGEGLGLVLLSAWAGNPDGTADAGARIIRLTETKWKTSLRSLFRTDPALPPELPAFRALVNGMTGRN